MLRNIPRIPRITHCTNSSISNELFLHLTGYIMLLGANNLKTPIALLDTLIKARNGSRTK